MKKEEIIANVLEWDDENKLCITDKGTYQWDEVSLTKDITKVILLAPYSNN